MRATFLLLAYNQEAFAAEAVRAALAQECEPITILISDDASRDETFAVIEAAVADYEGPHRVVLNRNPQNLGIAGHINACMARIDTEIVVGAAADDISKPQRVARVLEVFAQTDALLVHSDFDVIDNDGKCVQENVPEQTELFRRTTSAQSAATQIALYTGATGAWHRDLFDRFGDISEGCYEDLVLGFRAALERRIAFVDESLVQYRAGIGVSMADASPSGPGEWRAARLRVLTLMRATFEQRLHDMARTSHPDRAAITADLRHALRLNKLRAASYDRPPVAFLAANIGSLPLATQALLSERRKSRRAERRSGSKKST